MKVDDVITAVNGDLQSCLAPVRDRFRLAMSTIFDYAVANPTQGNPATAQTAIATAFKVHYPDGLISPGITIEQGTLAFVNRHGVGATTALKWVSVRNFIVERSAFKSQVATWLEEGSLRSLLHMQRDLIIGNSDIGISAPVDLVVVKERVTGKTPADPDYNLIYRKTYSSASLGKTYRETYSYDVSSGIAVPSVTEEIL